MFGRDGGLARDGEDVVVQVDVDLVFGKTWQLKLSRYEVLLLVLVDVNSVGERSAPASIGEAMRRLTSGVGHEARC